MLIWINQIKIFMYKRVDLMVSFNLFREAYKQFRDSKTLDTEYRFNTGIRQ